MLGKEQARRDLVGKPELKEQLLNPSRKFGSRGDNIKRDIQEI
jgi:hypothetical protein